jgi:hypothetical protein
MICRNCGVEFDDATESCPLCGLHVTGIPRERVGLGHREVVAQNTGKGVLGRILWQVTSVLLMSGIASTLIINLSLQRQVTWSIYPVTICIILLCYAAPLSIWFRGTLTNLLSGWVAASICLLIIAYLPPGHGWAIKLALPIVCTLNLAVLLVLGASRLVRSKALNVLALVFLVLAAACLTIDGIISVYLYDAIKVSWSVIVAACLLPVTGTIFFMYFRMRNNSELKKIFHT